MEVEDVTAAHVVQIKGLNVQPLTLEQAIIVQGFTGVGTVSRQAMEQDMLSRGIDLETGTYRNAYREDFARLSVYQDEMASYKELATRVYDAILDKMHNDPFARWDSRVDILLATHLNHKTQAAIRVALELFYQATIEFTERPGTTDQTWIVINRPEPYMAAMDRAVMKFSEFWDNHNNDTLFVNDKFQSQLQMIMSASLPKAHEAQYLRRVGEIVGSGDTVPITVTVERERFKAHAPTVVITRQFKEPTYGEVFNQDGKSIGVSGPTSNGYVATGSGVAHAHGERGWQPK